MKEKIEIIITVNNTVVSNKIFILPSSEETDLFLSSVDRSIHLLKIGKVEIGTLEI